MGYIKPEIYQSLCADTDKKVPNVFIETGTFKGGIPARMLDEDGTLEPFKKIYTIELGYDICKIASRRFKLLEQGPVDPKLLHTDDMDENFVSNSWQEYCDGKLTLCHGDSATELKRILEKIDEPICFWLDAHGGADKYASTEEVPLLNELEAIKNHHIKNHIIAIDDAHLFGKVQYDKTGNVVCDYTHMSQEAIEQKLLEINPSYDIGIYAPYQMEMLLAI